MVDLINDPDCPKGGRHRKLEMAEIRKSEDAVQRAVAAVNNFTNPFAILDKDRLNSLGSGDLVSYRRRERQVQSRSCGKRS